MIGGALATDDDRGATASVGMIVALSALAMTFAALLLAYGIVRAQAPLWPPPGEPPLPPLWGWRAVATLASLGGSAAMAYAVRRARAGLAVRSALAGAAASGATFLAAQATALLALERSGIGPGAGLAASVVYAFSLFHGLHVLVALVALAPLARGGSAVRVGAVAAFWHLVTAVWMAVFVGVFVL